MPIDKIDRPAEPSPPAENPAADRPADADRRQLIADRGSTDAMPEPEPGFASTVTATDLMTGRTDKIAPAPEAPRAAPQTETPPGE